MLPAAPTRSRWRMELTERDDGVLIVNDAYNANPRSMHAALDTVAEMIASRAASGDARCKGWAVLGDMLGWETRRRRSIGRWVSTRCGMEITRLIAVGSFADEIVAEALAAGARAVGATSLARMRSRLQRP